MNIIINNIIKIYFYLCISTNTSLIILNIITLILVLKSIIISYLHFSVKANLFKVSKNKSYSKHDRKLHMNTSANNNLYFDLTCTKGLIISYIREFVSLV